MLHYFTQPIDPANLPKQLPSPFGRTPHPLCADAAEQVKGYISAQQHWHKELSKGKMFGVLVVRTSEGETGFLAAFSGNLDGRNDHPYFVPPVADILSPDGFFRQGEMVISNINRQIAKLENYAEYTQAEDALKEESSKAQSEINLYKRRIAKHKELRDASRQEGIAPAEQERMVKESQFEKAELKRLERRWRERLDSLKKELDTYRLPIDELKSRRKLLSADLQLRLFKEFRFLNINGESKDLQTIFETTSQRVPPAGAGECAGPKLLQHAFLHNLTPVAMAEFWWGESPKAEIRHHGSYYGACKGKCEPILGHMLLGLDVAELNLNTLSAKNVLLDVVYEDEWLVVVNKPAGMLSVPGKSSAVSVAEKLHEMYPAATGPLVVHRLDMATSGLLMAAKTKEVHQKLQAMFRDRKVSKRYAAILDGKAPCNDGTIDLPLCPDIHDRPRQMVSRDLGKPAITRYEVVEVNEYHTLVNFYPLTGRTHQLRVHAAHPEGLNCPITGDELYGKKAERLYLHAEQLMFIHPGTNLSITICSPAYFSLSGEPFTR